MRVLIPGDDLSNLASPSVFLAGPSPRSDDVASWRPGAIGLLGAHQFQGDVLSPEAFTGDFDSQVAWEFEGLESADMICFWVQRDLETLPGFTTNVEFGRYLGRKPILYGRPTRAPKTRYLDWMYQQITGDEPFDSLELLIAAAAEL